MVAVCSLRSSQGQILIECIMIVFAFFTIITALVSCYSLYDRLLDETIGVKSVEVN